MKLKKAAFDDADFAAVKALALSFPGTTESLSHEGTPAVKMGRRLMCRLHETGAFIPIHLDFEHRDYYLDRYPEYFHLPDHSKAYPYLCLWTGCYDLQLLKEVLEKSWKGLASKKRIQQYESNQEQQKPS